MAYDTEFSTRKCSIFVVYVDRIPRDLGKVWSQIIKQDVEKPERFSITALTNAEMLKLRSDFIKANCDIVINSPVYLKSISPASR